MREPPQRWQRVLLWLILASWACCLTPEIGLVQAPFIVNRTPPLLGPPELSENSMKVVLEFEPRKPMAPGAKVAVTTEEASGKRPRAILLFEANSPAGPQAGTVQEFGSNELPSPRVLEEFPRGIGAVSKGFAKNAGAVTAFPRLSDEAPRVITPVAPAASEEDAPIALTAFFAQPRSVHQQRPSFGHVVGLKGVVLPVWTYDLVRFLTPQPGAVSGPGTRFERPVAADVRMHDELRK